MGLIKTIFKGIGKGFKFIYKRIKNGNCLIVEACMTPSASEDEEQQPLIINIVPAEKQKIEVKSNFHHHNRPNRKRKQSVVSITITTSAEKDEEETPRSNSTPLDKK